MNTKQNGYFKKIKNIDDLVFEMIVSDKETAEKILKENNIDIEKIKSDGLKYLQSLNLGGVKWQQT